MRSKIWICEELSPHEQILLSVFVESDMKIGVRRNVTFHLFHFSTLGSGERL